MKSLSINLKLTLSALAITVVSLLSAGLLINQSLLQYHREVAHNKIEDAFESLQGHIQEVERRLIIETGSVADEQVIISALNLINKYEQPNSDSDLFDDERKRIGLRIADTVRSGITDEAYLYNQRGTLQIHTAVEASSYRVNVASRQDRLLSYTNEIGKQAVLWKVTPYSDKLRSRITQHLADSDGLDYHRDLDGLFVEHHRPVLRTHANGTQEQIGSLVFLHRLDQEFVESSAPTEIAFSIFDSSQKPIIDNPKLASLTPTERANLLSHGADSTSFLETESGFYASHRIETQRGDWIDLIAIFPMIEYTLASQRTRRAVIAAMLATGLIVITASLLLLQRFIRTPLSGLMTGVRKFREGDYGTRLQTTSMDEFGQLASAMNLMAQDIEQRESELSAIIDQLPLMIFVKNVNDLRFVRLNRAGEKLLGVRHKDMLGLNDYDLFPKEQADFFTQKDREVIASGSIADIPEEEINTPQGVRILHTRKATIFDKKGNPKYLLGLSEDITERKKTEAQLRQWAKAIDSTSEGIMITDLKGKIIDVNDAFTKITGYAHDEIVGQNPRLLQSGLHNEEFYQLMWKTLMETGSWRGEIQNRRNNGEIFHAWETISTVYNDNNERTHLVAVFSDISPIKQTQKELDFLAHHDPLTGLPNRILLNDRMEHALMRAHRDNLKVGIMFLDLDRFKNINDSLGHPVGDTLLQEVSDRLGRVLREIDTISRQGGDEFILVLEDIQDDGTLVNVANKVLSIFKQPFTVSGRDMIISASLGISVYPDDGHDTTTLIRNADSAMYRAKENGRNRFWFYTEDITRRTARRMEMEQALRDTVNHGELDLHYQPQYDLLHNRIVAAEGLLRWDRPGHGIVMPDHFIPLAEETGVINVIGEWVVYTACRQMRHWLDEALPIERIAINISPIQIRHGNLPEIVSDALSKTGLSPEHLELEVTEAIFLDDTQETGKVLHALDELGVTLALDDFGTGFSSLSYLKNFHFDRLKIDRSFVQHLLINSNDQSIANSVIALGHNLNMSVLAEGVETEAQRAWLSERHCDEAQGYLFSRPVPPDKLIQLITDKS